MPETVSNEVNQPMTLMRSKLVLHLLKKSETGLIVKF